MNRTVVFGGDLENIIIDGDAQLITPIDGQNSIIETIREGVLPEYTGAYEITPTNAEQVLPTMQTSVLADIVIKPIPQNYGLITWNGSTITVS